MQELIPALACWRSPRRMTAPLLETELEVMLFQNFGFVYFKTREGPENAVAMKSSELCGEGILVKMGDPNAGGKKSDIDSKWCKGSGSSSGPIRRDKEGRQHPYKG